MSCSTFLGGGDTHFPLAFGGTCTLLHKSDNADGLLISINVIEFETLSSTTEPLSTWFSAHIPQTTPTLCYST